MLPGTAERTALSNFRKLRTPEVRGIRSMRSSQTSHLGRVGEVSAGAVVATDTASADADHDNGITLRK
jgi:hypothetical protein